MLSMCPTVKQPVFGLEILRREIKLPDAGKPEAIAVRDDYERRMRKRRNAIEMLMKTDNLQGSLGSIAKRSAPAAATAPPPTSSC